MQSKNQKRETAIERLEDDIRIFERHKMDALRQRNNALEAGKPTVKFDQKACEMDERIVRHQRVIDNTRLNIKLNSTAKERRDPGYRGLGGNS